MSSKKSVLIDLGKLKNLYTGLGQVSMNFGKEIQSVSDEELEWRFLIPKNYTQQFGTPPLTEFLSSKRRYFPSLCPKYDLWHAIHQDSAYFPALSHATKYLLTIHDLNFLKEKTGSKAAARLNRLQKKVDRADALVFISEFSKKEALSALNTGDKSLHVIYNGITTIDPPSLSRPSFLPNETYLFSIGALTPKKNFHVLVKFLKQTQNFNLVIAGQNKNEYALEILKEAAREGVTDRLILPGEIDEPTKAYLYKNCAAFCFPSLHEGFGLPVVEAMRYGKPVFVSNLSSLPEIGKEHAFYWDSFNPTHMTEVFRRGMTEYNNNKELRRKTMIEYANQYTWKKNVQEYIELYKQILGTNHSGV